MSDPTIDKPILSANQILGWGVLYVMLIAAADIPGLGKISASFAWLLFLSILLFYGVDFFNNLGALSGGYTITTSDDGTTSIDLTGGN